MITQMRRDSIKSQNSKTEAHAAESATNNKHKLVHGHNRKIHITDIDPSHHGYASKRFINSIFGPFIYGFGKDAKQQDDFEAELDDSTFSGHVLMKLICSYALIVSGVFFVSIAILAIGCKLLFLVAGTYISIDDFFVAINAVLARGLTLIEETFAGGPIEDFFVAIKAAVAPVLALVLTLIGGTTGASSVKLSSGSGKFGSGKFGAGILPKLPNLGSGILPKLPNLGSGILPVLPNLGLPTELFKFADWQAVFAGAMFTWTVSIMLASLFNQQQVLEILIAPMTYFAVALVSGGHPLILVPPH